MFERFTDRARRALVEGQNESVEGRHGFLGTEHILIGLVRMGEGAAFDLLSAAGVTLGPLREKVGARLAEWVDPNSVAVSEQEALAAIGIDLASVKASVEATFGPGALPDRGATPPFTPKAKESLESALHHALALRHSYIATEHLLLGVLDQVDGVAYQSLQDLGVDIAEFKTRIIEQVAPTRARAGSAWRTYFELTVALSRLEPEQREQAAAVRQALGAARATVTATEQEQLDAIAIETATALEAAVESARASLSSLAIDV